MVEIVRVVSVYDGKACELRGRGVKNTYYIIVIVPTNL